MDKKTIIIIAIIISIGAACFFSGCIVESRRNDNTGDVGSSDELYNDSLERISELESELTKSERLRGQLIIEIRSIGEELSSIERGINNSQSLVESGAELARDIATDSGSLGDIIRKCGGNSTAIDNAGRGLAELFGLKTEGN